MPTMDPDTVATALITVVKSLFERGEDATIADFDAKVIRGLLDKNAPLPNVPTPWSPDYENLRRCSSVDEVRTVVLEALAQGKVVRAAGAQHSAPQAIFARKNPNNIHIKLEGSLRDVTVLSENREEGSLVVRAGAGANLGIDPSDPGSNAGNSFNRIVDELGYALPILGGMSHQTLGGYMMTNTAGGSLDHGFADSLLSFELVDGRGEIRRLDKGSDDFDAAAVSMGLFGVITSVTLKLGKNYLVKGYEETVATERSILASAEALQAALSRSPYVHAVWFAQHGVDRVLQFQATQAPTTERVVPYVHPLHERTRNYVAALALTAANVLGASGVEIERKLAAYIIRLMNPISENPSYFCDHWYLALPNDDQALIDKVIRVQFTEIWLDVAQMPYAYAALQKLFAADPAAAGNFGVEVYGAKASPFWMSPSHGCNVVRIDPYWWEYNPKGDPQTFFAKYWEALLPIATSRLSWGKHFPRVGAVFGDRVIGPDYMEKSFPRFRDWLAKRKEYDPHQVFMIDYWRELFGIAPIGAKNARRARSSTKRRAR